MPTKLFEMHPTPFRVEMFTVMNQGFQCWEPAPKAVAAKALHVITADDLGDGAFTTQIAGVSLIRLKKDLGRNGIQHVTEPAENLWRTCGRL